MFHVASQAGKNFPYLKQKRTAFQDELDSSVVWLLFIVGSCAWCYAELAFAIDIFYSIGRNAERRNMCSNGANISFF
jgi:hypothetical protein